jgi:hypothetical protein
MWDGGQRHAPAALPPGKIRYPLYRRLGGPQGRSVQVRKIVPATGFDPRTVQPVASRYTDWAIPAHIIITIFNLFLFPFYEELTCAVSVYFKFVGRKLQVVHHRHVCSCSVTIFHVEAGIVMMSPCEFPRA